MNASLPVYVISLGCPKNRVDTERLLGGLGQGVVLTPYPGRAKLIIVNTCAFIEPAVRESIRTIIEITEKVGRLKKKPLLAIAGCLPGRYGLEELRKEFPEIDLWLLPEDIHRWPALIGEKLGNITTEAAKRFFPENSSYAWVKIAEGCNHKCAFCAIPVIRGQLRSEKAEDILLEAQGLLRKGVKELDLVAQDVLGWGKDFEKQQGPLLPELLKKLACLPGLAWLRLLYLYPNSITRNLLEQFATIGKPLLPYLDIPFQHSEREILKMMGRPFRTDPYRVIEMIRAILPDAALRATFIVGFPGETDRQFRNLCDFVKTARFHNMGVFTYHAEEGTPAAEFSNQIPEEVKQERRNSLMEIQARISAEILASYVGNTMEVLVDSDRSDEWPGLHAGRVWFQAPEVDGLTFISGKDIKPGKIVNCEIVDSQIYDLSAIV